MKRKGGEEGAMAVIAGSSWSISRSLAARSCMASAMEMGFGTVSEHSLGQDEVCVVVKGVHTV